MVQGKSTKSPLSTGPPPPLLLLLSPVVISPSLPLNGTSPYRVSHGVQGDIPNLDDDFAFGRHGGRILIVELEDILVRASAGH